MSSTFIGCKVKKNPSNNSNITHKKVYSNNLFSIIRYSCAISSGVFVVLCFVMQWIVRVRIYYNEQSDKTRFSNLLSIDNNTQIYIPSAEYTIRFIVSYFCLP